MPAIRAPSVTHSLRSAYMGFLTSYDERVPLPRTLPVPVERRCQNSSIDYLHHDDSYLSQWIASSTIFSELEAYEPVSHYPPPSFNHASNEDSYHRYDPFDSTSFPFYDTASSSSSGSPFPVMTESGIPLHAMSPSISITSSSPRSEPGALSPPLSDFPGLFDLDYGPSASLGGEFHPSDSWSTSRLSPLSASPSPSCSSVEVKPGISRDASPLTGETEKVDRRRFPCLILGCNRKFTSQYTLKVHMEAHKPKPRVSFPCTEGCSERFSRQHDRLRHEVAKHGKICEFLCDECGRFFSTKKTLGNHKCPVAQGGTRWVTS
ncbi:hypothetical protein CC2G_004789 [Coprinopsis cinerea AmutBmut pab1-1]|nr:hypothetical protein CC2G_004789 [Coprinopsis cinerea AmutBmut pab1-1]